MKFTTVLAIGFVLFCKSAQAASLFAQHQREQMKHFEGIDLLRENDVKPFPTLTNRGPFVKLIQGLVKETQTYNEDQNWRQVLTQQNANFKPTSKELASRQHWSKFYMPGGKRGSQKEAPLPISNPLHPLSELDNQTPLGSFDSPERRQHWSFDLYPGGK